MRLPPAIPPAKYPLQIVGGLLDREIRRKRRELKKKFPEASVSEIEKKLNRWMGRKPPLKGPDFVKVPRREWPAWARQAPARKKG